jgi:hypothetical protein
LLGLYLERTLARLGVFDCIQGIGLYMILLQMFSRLHVCAILVLIQIIASNTIMVVRRTALNRIGLGSDLPDTSACTFSDGIKSSSMAFAPF